MVAHFGRIRIAEPWGRATISRQHGDRIPLRGPVAAHEDPSRGVGCAAGRLVGGNQDAGVIEPDPTCELHTRRRTAPRRPHRTTAAVLVGRQPILFGIEADTGRVVEHELGTGRPRLDPPAGPARQLQPWQIGQYRQSVDEAVNLSA